MATELSDDLKFLMKLCGPNATLAQVGDRLEAISADLGLLIEENYEDSKVSEFL